MRLFTILILACGPLLAFAQDDLATSIERGQLIYEDFCVTCHQGQGEGVIGAFPPLAGSDYLLEKREAAIRAVKFGQQGKITVNDVEYNGFMTPLYLSDDEVADVINYVSNTWGNKADYVSEETVTAVEKL